MEVMWFLAGFALEGARPGPAPDARRQGPAAQYAKDGARNRGIVMDPQAIFDNYRRIVTRHYFDMTGRVGRSEFWYFVLANFVFAVIAAILQSVTFLPLLAIYNLAMILPSAGMGARRLQDTG